MMWYAYAVCAIQQDKEGPWPSGLTPQLSVESVQLAPGLHVLASQVPDEVFLPDPTAAGPLVGGPEDPAWVAEAALAHHEVVLAAHLRGDVLPLRFGTVFRSEAEMRAHFHQIAGELRTRLDSIADSEEIEITLEIDREVLEEALLAPRRGEWAAMPAGRRYLAERAARLTLDDEIEAMENQAWARLEHALSESIRGTFARTRSARAYLVKRSCKDLFEFVEKNREQADGLRFELAGVWPPYSFAGGDVTVSLKVENSLPDGQALTVPEVGSDGFGARSL